jgi:large subunit ribosomal protein L25
MSDLVVEVTPREQRGKNNSRRLRRAGSIPAIVYGGRKDTVPVSVDPEAIVRIIRSESGENTIFQLSLKGTGKSRHVMIKDYQVDPVQGRLMHADFVRIQMDEVVEVDVPIRLSGESPGVKLDGGILEHVTREVRVTCLPGDIPEHISVDVSKLRIGDSLRVSDLAKAEKYKILEDPEQTLVNCSPPTKEEVAPEAVEAAAEEPSEPEVLKKGKAVGEAEEEKEGEKKKKKEKEDDT